MGNKKAPVIRFKGYTEDWEQRKLKDLADKVSVGIATSSSQYFSNREQGIPFIKNQNIKGNWIDDKNLEYISKEFDKANSTKRIKEGDILTVRTGYPGLSAVVPKELDGAQTFTTLITRLKKGIAIPEFVSIFINSDAGMKQILGMEAGGAQKNVNAGILQNLSIPLPSLVEQKKISKFVIELDKTIALHQRKLSLFNQLKETYLKRMFPQNEENMPVLRFADFSEPWEQRKLGEISDIVGGGTPSTSTDYYWNGNIDWYSPAEIGNQIFVNDSQKKITEAGLQKSSAKILPIGAVLFTSRAGIGNTAILAKEGATNQGFQSIIPHENELDSYFIYSRTHELKRYGELNGAGSTFIEVSGKQMAKMPILMPRIEEQIHIGIFFRKLDDTITLHQYKIKNLTVLKKVLLAKMFL